MYVPISSVSFWDPKHSQLDFQMKRAGRETGTNPPSLLQTDIFPQTEKSTEAVRQRERKKDPTQYYFLKIQTRKRMIEFSIWGVIHFSFSLED